MSPFFFITTKAMANWWILAQENKLNNNSDNKKAIKDVPGTIGKTGMWPEY